MVKRILVAVKEWSQVYDRCVRDGIFLQKLEIGERRRFLVLVLGIFSVGLLKNCSDVSFFCTWPTMFSVS